MAGWRRGVTAGLLLWVSGALADPPAPTPSPGFPELENLRRTFEALPPEQREKFRENFQRWMNLPPEEKKLLREREEVRRTHMAEEIDKAIKESGLILTPEQKAVYTRRYTEERRQIEQKLGEQRRPMVQSLVTRLKEEFGQGSSRAAATPTVSATPAPPS